jgi:hypothetical protein
MDAGPGSVMVPRAGEVLVSTGESILTNHTVFPNSVGEPFFISPRQLVRLTFK